jgi:hypothetical protein
LLYVPSLRTHAYFIHQRVRPFLEISGYGRPAVAMMHNHSASVVVNPGDPVPLLLSTFFLSCSAVGAPRPRLVGLLAPWRPALKTDLDKI